VWWIEEWTGLLMRLEQLVYLYPQRGVIGAGAIQKGSALGRVLDVERFKENVAFGHGRPRK
jgi:hypothetical protein